ncbi:MAG: hypothetical protein Q9187_001847 [Circinaria calcarea]
MSETPEDKFDEVLSKRKRGRPKKNVPAPSTTVSKIAKGRSKTGCVTCRKRKKKCDEAKPSCLNCQKNAVVCEGYPVKRFWEPGNKRRPEEMRRYSFTFPRCLPFLVDGIETDIDRRFLDHFVFELSGVLTIHDDDSNPFKDLLLPMATQHSGLMHSLMALSGSHIIAKEPNPDFKNRQLYHYSIAISTLNATIRSAIEGDQEASNLLVEDPAVASTIVHCLISICSGSTNGDYRIHMNGARSLIAKRDKRKSKNPEFQRFIMEFFMYHNVMNSLTSLDRRPISFDDDDDRSLPSFLIQPALQPGAGLMVGVLEGLFKYITRITVLRDSVRRRIGAGLEPAVVYESLSQAVLIDAGIRDWDPKQETNTPLWVAAQLYRQCTWVYLYRTIQASRPSAKICAAVDDGLDYLRVLTPTESVQCVLLLPIFLLGCAAFEKRQRPDLETAFDNLQAYSNLGNIRPARQVVRRVWEMMDNGDDKSWDWEGIMASMDIDLLVT